MNVVPYVVIFVLLGGLLLMTTRNRKRQVAEELVRISRIGVGSEVMTTSGLYGTVVAKHEDGTVLLAVAPGVEVKWALAALRDADSLSVTYRRALGDDADGADAPGVDPGSDTVELRKRDDAAG